MRQKTITTKLIQNVTQVYYKVHQVLQSVSGITNSGRMLLQSALSVTTCGRFLLQSVSDITKCDSYYKVRHNTAGKVNRNVDILALTKA